MVMTKSEMLPLGTPAPGFRLPDAHGREFSLDDRPAAKAYLVVFMCNHCPYVKHLRDALAELGHECESKGVVMVGINANDADRYPDDAPDRMKEEARTYGYGFPYLIDDTQEVAKAYRAACTPDFFLFDAEKKLVYRGQFDSSRPSNDEPITGEDLRAAIEATLAGEKPSDDQRPSIGCNIKWKSGNEPDWFG
jgi:peroxiredoxin